MNDIDINWLNQALQMISNNLCDKLEKDNITIYRCGKIVRIDIKSI